MRTSTRHIVALAAAFFISAGFSFVANGADRGRHYDSGSTYKPAARSYGSWAGAYAGGILGYGFSDIDLAGAPDLDPDGFFGGGLLGFNWQNQSLVLSLEGDLLGGDLDDAVTFGANRVRGDLEWMAALRARAGVAVNPTTLLFVTLGYGWAHIDLPLAGPGGGGGDETFSGWQYGLGAEFKLDARWSARFDYNYTDLDSETITYAGGAAINYEPDLHQLRAGIVLKF